MVFYVIYGCLLFSSGVYSIKRYFASESCGHVYGPDQLTVLEFDKNVDYDKSKPSTEQNLLPPFDIRNTIWECIIVVRGMPSTSSNKSIGLQWRDFHIWDPDMNTVADSVEECGKAYVTIYRGDDTSARKRWTLCGKDTTRIFFEWVGDYITFKFYADFRRNESYVPPTTVSPPSTLPTTLRTDCVSPGNDTESVTSGLPLCVTKNVLNTTTTPLDTYPYPEIYFRADITSFDYACEKSVPGETLKCNDSRRCIDESLMCDFFFSQNCKSSGFPQDKSDQTRDAPAYCFRKETTTPIPTTTTEPPPKPFNWKPIAGVVGAILGILILCWCCWRPGYLPWRLSRLRNVPFFNTQKCVCCRRGPTVCCPCLRCCAGNRNGTDDTDFVGTVGGGTKRKSLAGRGYGNKGLTKNGAKLFGNPSTIGGKYNPPANGQVSNAPSPSSFYGKDPNNFASDWLKLISGDGAHLREQR